MMVISVVMVAAVAVIAVMMMAMPLPAVAVAVAMTDERHVSGFRADGRAGVERRGGRAANRREIKQRGGCGDNETLHVVLQILFVKVRWVHRYSSERQALTRVVVPVCVNLHQR